MKTFTLAAIFTAVNLAAGAQRLLTEDFNYAPGQLTAANAGANVSGGAWTDFSGTGKFIQVTSTNLSYPNYFTSPSGSSGSIALDTSILSAEDAYTAFTSQTSGTVYCSFLVDILLTDKLALNTSDSSEYFVGLFPSNSTSNYFCRLFARQGAATGTVNFGISAQSFHSTPIVWAPADYAINTTHLITLGYQIVSGANNDVAKLWVDNAYSATEPAPLASSLFTLGTEPIDVTRVAVRQGYALTTTGSTPKCMIDAFKISTTWAATLPLHLLSFSAVQATTGSVSLNWVSSNEVNMNKYVVEKSTDSRNFEAMGEVAAKNNASATNYTFSDSKLLTPQAFYRLNMVDNDGSFRYSATLMVSGKLPTSLSVYPNPVGASLVLSHPQAVQGAVLQVISFDGKKTVSYSVAAGAVQTSVDVSKLAKGNYFAVFINGVQKQTIGFLKQ